MAGTTVKGIGSRAQGLLQVARLIREMDQDAEPSSVPIVPRPGSNGLLDFTQATFPGYRAEPAHHLIASRLDAIVAGDLKRLMIFAPPQHGKSELASVRLPAYWLGKRPEDPIILTSYAASLADSKSRQARQVVESPEYATVFPGITTRRDSRAVNHWEMQGHRGRMLSAGVGGSITGFGATLGIIDDPLENWQEAQSTTVRETCWEWYRTTFRTRIWEGGAIILIMTRWHEDDLAGRLLNDQGSRWEVLRLPALAEDQADRDVNDAKLGLPTGRPDPLGRSPGDPLCPGRFSAAELESIKRDVGTMAWAGQYGGNPRAAEGNRFKRAWFPITPTPPIAARRVRYWDQAGSMGSGCFTAGVLIARTEDGVYYIEDVVRGQWSAAERDAVMLQTAHTDKELRGQVSIWVEQEPGSGGKESAENKIRMLSGFTIQADKVTGSKEVRAEPLASQAEGGNIRVVAASWNAVFIEEMASFPTGKYADQVDAASGAFNKLPTLKKFWIK